MDVANVLIKPIISEKSMRDAGLGKFTFRVARQATKHAVKKAVSEQFNVTVVSVSTTVVKGRKKRVGLRRLPFREPTWKRARVKLATGQTIGVFDVTKEQHEKA